MKLCLLCVMVLATTTTALAQTARPPSARFVSEGALRWEVLVDNQPACVTPCAIDVPSGYWVTMRTVEDRPVRVDVGLLDGPVTVSAKPMAEGAYVTGIVFTTLGGMAVVTGITLTAVGCTSDDRRGMCLAGLITGGVGGVVTAGSILLMVRSVPRVQIHRNASLLFTPTGASVAGTF
jgi:hypothetical protein